MPSSLTERLDPTLDVVFKLLFSSDEELLIALLTAVLRPEKRIASAQVRNPELPKDFSDDKGASSISWSSSTTGR